MDSLPLDSDWQKGISTDYEIFNHTQIMRLNNKAEIMSNREKDLSKGGGGKKRKRKKYESIL